MSRTCCVNSAARDLPLAFANEPRCCQLLHWTAHVQAFSCGYSGAPCLSALFCSVQPVTQKRAIVMGAFARCKQLSSCEYWLLLALAEVYCKFTCVSGYPMALMSKWLRCYCVSNLRKQGVQLFKDVLAHGGRCQHPTSPAQRDSFRYDTAHRPVGSANWATV